MFYYAQINDNYEVINVHSLAQVSTNENYIEITEEQYTSGELVGKFYNSLSGTFEIMTDSMGSTDNVQVDWTEMMLSTKLDNMQVEINSKADIDHTHTGYVSSDDLQVLEDVIDTKADASHTHTEYALSAHTHDDYATQISLDTLSEEVEGKADISHNHTEYAETTHTHDDYSSVSHTHTASEIGAASSTHNHDEDYADINHNHDSAYATINHNHEEDYSAIDHSHSDYVTTTDFNELSAIVSNKANVSHSHDDTYYTETEIDTKLAGKSDTTHTHTGVYDASGSAASALTSANAYTDSKIDALVGEGASTTLDTIGEISLAIEDNQDAIDLLNAAIGTKANITDLNSHANDTEIHITDAERDIWNAKSDFSGNYNDLTNKPSIPSIDGLASENYVDDKVDAITAESIGALPNTTVIPTVPTNVSAFTNDTGYLTEHQSLDGLATETYVDTQIDAIVIPTALSDLTTDSTHRLVTDTEKAAWNAKSDFSGSYNDLTNKPSIPSISSLATETYVDEAVSAKADSGHIHDNRYYTETEVDTLLSAKANSNHNHNASYDALGTAETKANAVQANLDVVNEDLTEHIENTDVHFTVAERNKLSGIAANANNYTHPNSGVTAGTYKSVTVNAQGHITSGSNPTTLAGYGITDAETKGAASSALTSAKAYTDELVADEVANRDSAIATAKSSAISTAASDATTKANNALASAKTYADNAATTVKNDLLNNAGAAYDTLKELGDLIDDNADAIEALESVASGKANAVHTHAISDITNLQSTLNGKAATNHGTHVSYSTTAPVMDGTASVGSASTVARSDHKHPTDTSRAAQTSLDSHTSDTTKHITSSERTNWNSAKTHADSAHAPSNAEKNQNAFGNVKVGSTTIAADLPTDTLTLVAGANVTITPDATGDSVTISSADTVYTHPTTSGNKHIPAGGSNGQILRWSADGTATWGNDNNTTYSNATTSTAGLMSASDKSKLDGIASGANAYTLPTASSTLGGVKTTSTVTSNSGYTACPIIGGVPYYKDTNTTYNLGSFGITATAAELNALDGITATVTELNYMDGVTSNVQTQLNGKAASSHGTHVTYGTTAPKANGTAAVGTATTVSRSDHVHPLQTTVSGNAGTATKLATARTISLTGDVTGSTSFDGSGNVSITATVADDSHNHTIANVDGLQSALDGKSATSHNHNSAYISKDLQFTGDNGGAIISYNRDDGKNILTEIAALPAGFYTIYSQSGTSGNPKTTEAWRFMVHKTGTTSGWVQGYGSIGSVYTNYIDGTNGWRGWRCIWDYDPNPLWSGQYYMSSPNSTPQTVTPSKKLSECRTGWLLLWSDYDAGSGSNDSDFVTTVIPKNNPSGGTWGGKSFLCDIPRYVGSNAEDVDTERRIIKPIYVHDDCIKGSYQNDKDERNDVVLRAVYEI